MRSKGLTIISFKGDLHLPHVTATDDPAAIGPADIVFFTVKLYDAAAATPLLAPLIGPETAVIPLQNGVDGVDIVSNAVGRPHTGGGTVYVAAVMTEPGVIKHSALDHLIFGELDGTRTPRLERLLDACKPAGFQATLSDSIQVDIWTKFVRLSVFSGMTAVTRQPIGPIVADPELFAMLKTAAREAMAVARTKGIPIPDTVIDDVERSYVALPPHMKSSMLEDLERGRRLELPWLSGAVVRIGKELGVDTRLELPWLSGAVVRIGKELGVDTPTHRFIATVLKPYVNGL
jgi:2-dehydropantoate 2-reductase